MKHRLNWFSDQVGKKVYCNVHYKGEICEGILVDNDAVAYNLWFDQKSGVEFFKIKE